MNILKTLDINTIILFLILMMMFGSYSQKYFNSSNWGTKWGMRLISPFVYYASGSLAILLCVWLLVRIIILIIGG